MLCTPLFKIRNIYSFFVSLLLTSPSFCHFLDYSAHFHLLQFTSSFGLIIPKNVPDYSSLCDILLAYYIGFENVCCYYINLIDSKYSISSLKAFGSSCCHYSQKAWFHKGESGGCFMLINK